MYTAGFLLFIAIFGLAFWVLIFLSAFALPYAITQYFLEKFKSKQAKKREARTV